MKTTLALLTAAALFAGFSAETAEAAKVKQKVVTKTIHKSPFGHKVVEKDKVVTVHRTGPSFGHVHHSHHAPSHGFSASFSFGRPVYAAPVVYAPQYHYIHKQIWVPAVTQQVIVGYGPCGTPLYDTVVVTPACYKTARYKVFPSGPQIFVGYVG